MANPGGQGETGICFHINSLPGLLATSSYSPHAVNDHLEPSKDPLIWHVCSYKEDDLSFLHLLHCHFSRADRDLPALPPYLFILLLIYPSVLVEKLKAPFTAPSGSASDRRWSE